MNSTQATAPDRARLVNVGSGFGSRVAVLRTQYRSQCFARHSHDDYTLGLVLAGAGTFWCRGTERLASEGDLVVIPPGEVHTGSVRRGMRSLSYLAMHLPVDLATLHAGACGVGAGKPPEFGATVLRDAAVRLAFQTLDDAIGFAGDSRGQEIGAGRFGGGTFDEGAAEQAVCLAIAGLMARHAQPATGNGSTRHSPASAREPRLVSIVRAVLEDSYANPEETSLLVLAKRTGVTPFRVIRAFREATGLPPHQYLIQVRVERARQFLANGVIPSLAALKTGFTDQSHLTYHFKKHLGITPGNYQRCVAVS